jgi:hypothetical protein
MKLTIKPEEVIVKPAVYKVKFNEGRDYPNFVGGDSGYETMNDFRSDIKDWLDTNAPGWTANFDRGDWGEGPATVTIHFKAEDHARAFVEKYETIPCPNSKSRGDCPNMGMAVREARARKDGKSHCPKCFHPIQILNEYNREDFLKNNA